jgi:hypothetical protein
LPLVFYGGGLYFSLKKEEVLTLNNQHYAYYGNVKMDRLYCERCKAYTFIIDGESACCDEPAENLQSKPFKVIIPPRPKRMVPTQYEKEAILESQEGKCFYCELEFGQVVWDNRKKKARVLKINWDHFTPFAYSLNNNANNFVASCNICNSLKSSKVFETIDEARLYLRKRWLDKEIYL